MTRYLTILLIGATIEYAMGKCTFTTTKKKEHVSCSNITSEDYLTSVFEIRTNIFNSMPKGNIAKISIHIADSHVPVVDEWLFLPWDDNFSFIQSIKIVNSSVNTVKSLSKLSAVETLDLSGNNISDYRFLNKMKKLRNLHLRYSRFSSDSYLFTYLQRETIRLNIVDLSYCNLDRFDVRTNLIDNYDLSFNPNLSQIQFNHSVGYRAPFLNISGNNNRIILKHLRAVDSFCLSLDLSNSSNSLDVLLSNSNTIYISEKLLLNDNNISSLNESSFKLSKLMSRHCPNRITVDISNSHLTHISSNFFSSHVFNLINLSHNNLGAMQGSIFRQSDILNLDLSNSFITSIAPSVFNYLTVDTLDLSRNNISSLDSVFDYIESMKHLDASSNPIETLDQNTFKNCHDLETLNLANAFIKALGEGTFLNIASLKTLILSFKDSIDAGLIGNMYVTELRLINTTVARLNAEQFNGYYKLRKLTFENSSASAIDNLAFNGLFSVKRINNLKEVGNYDLSVFQRLYSLEYLDLSRHDLKKLSLELKDLYSLRKLNLSSNAILSVDVNSFDTLKQLEVLSLSDNQLTTLVMGTFRHLNKLTHLYLNKNQLQQLPPGIFAGLEQLLVLDLSRNDLLRTKPHLIFGVSLPKLTKLFLQGNGLGNEYAKSDDVVRRNEFAIIANHNSLDYVDINENGWRCPTLIDILVAFKNKNITYFPTSPDYTRTNINGVSCT